MGTSPYDPIEFRPAATSSGGAVRRRRSVADRHLSAQRLLLDAAEETYDGDLDIDWSAPIDPEKVWLPAHLSTLHDTGVWRKMTPEQRATLGRHELVNLLTLAMYADAALSMVLFRGIIEASGPANDETRAALAAVHAESRTIAMFGRLVQLSGLAPYRRPVVAQLISKLTLLIPQTPALSAVALLVQQSLSALAAEIAVDPTVQPHVRQLMKIHRIAARRNIAFAHDRLIDEIAERNRVSVEIAAVLAALATAALYPALIAPRPYRAAEVPLRYALPAALVGGHYADAARARTADFVRLAEQAGLFGGPLSNTILRLGRVRPPRHVSRSKR